MGKPDVLKIGGRIPPISVSRSGETSLKHGTVFNISRYAIHDGPGIRTTLFLKGCPLSCWWCHNPEGISPEPELSLRLNRCIRCGTCVEHCPNHAISILEDEDVARDEPKCQLCFECARVCPADAREIVGKTMTVAEVMAEVRKDVAFYDESGGGVTFSGGEPLMQPAFLIELLDACGECGIHRAVDTSGYAAKETVLEVARRTDLFLYDIKIMDPAKHRKYTGTSNERILDNLKALSCRDVDIRIRVPLLPGINDDQDNIERTGAFLQMLHRVFYVDILPYHAIAAGKYERFGYTNRLNGLGAPEPARVREVADILSSYGLCVTIGGNEHERSHSQAQAIQP